jgi:hypothetical protein
MHKNKITVICTSFTILTLCLLCFIKFLELDYLKNRKNLLAKKARSMTELANTICETQWDELKSKEKIFSRKVNIKNFVERIVKKFSLQRVLFKMNNESNAGEKVLEIKFNVSDENFIYKFLDTLWYESAGVVGFESIKITRSNSNELFVKIKCKIFFFNEKETERSIEIIDPKHMVDVKSINLFNLRKSKEHHLLGILGNSGAYIDNTWYGVGDKIGDWKVLNIYQNSIEIQLNNRKSTIKLGSSW